MKQKGLTPILIVLLVALVVGGYLIYQKQPKPVSQPSPSPIASDETANAEQSRSANWKTYTNKYWGFGIKYPNSWSQIELQNQIEDKLLTDKMGFSAFVIYFGNILDKDHIGKTVTPYVNNILQITVFLSDKENLSVKDSSNKFLYCSGLYQEGVSAKNEVSTEIEGRKALVFKNTSCSLSGRTDIAYIVNGKQIYQIIYKIGNREGDIDQILSTFKFTQ